MIRASFFITMAIFILTLIVFALTSKKEEVVSEPYNNTSNGNIQYEDAQDISKDQELSDKIPNIHIDRNDQEKKNRPEITKRKKLKIRINLLGKQIFKLQENNTSIKLGPFIVAGTKFIAKLATGIDTRDRGSIIQVKTYVPVHTKEGGYIPKGSNILGQFSYREGTGRIFIKFTTLFLPDGKQFKISAIGISPNDYRPGLIGQNHSKILERVAGTIALSAISTASDVMTSRKQIGKSSTVTIKPNIQNAALQALSKATELEANRGFTKENDLKEYLTIEINQPIIIQFLKTLETRNDKN